MMDDDSLEFFLDQSFYLQELKIKLIAAINATTDEKKLEQCLELFHSDEMPCCAL